VREIEWKLLSELMKNSRRSDRELAKAIGSSQPTVSRIRKKLEEQGYIREYTMIPDFNKLGFGIMALTFSHFGPALSKERGEEVKKIYQEKMKEEHEAKEIARRQIMMQVEGKGLGYSGVTISFHKDYASSVEFMNLAEQNPHVELKNLDKKSAILEIDRIESFLINLKDETRYIPLTFSNLAKSLTRIKTKAKKE
jgi:DNA-binding Lrp family transcriptional regulator